MSKIGNRPFLVVDDHESIISSTTDILSREYPGVEIITAQTVTDAWTVLRTVQPQLAVTDLCLPKGSESSESTEAGIQFIQTLMQRYPTLNIVVQTAYPKSLIRLKTCINEHRGGFVVAGKQLALSEFISRVKISLQEATYTPKDMRPQIDLTHEQSELLRLAFRECLQDKAIAEKMNISERTARNYWTKIQNALDVYPQPGKNIRIMTQTRAREEGLID